MIIQLILIAGLLGLILYVLTLRNTIHLRASKKILFVGFVVFSLIAILNPNLLTNIAHLVGVGRGTDLLLYGFIFVLVFITLNVYLKFKDYGQRIDKLARNIAITEALARNNNARD